MNHLERIKACIQVAENECAIREPEHEELVAKLEADARALWAVRVLDAYARKVANPTFDPSDWVTSWFVALSPIMNTLGKFPSEDAARIAAATALVAADLSLDPDAPKPKAERVEGAPDRYHTHEPAPRYTLPLGTCAGCKCERCVIEDPPFCCKLCRTRNGATTSEVVK